MRTEPDQDRLLRENEDLRRQIRELRSAENGTLHSSLPHQMWRPSATAIWAIFLGVLVLVVFAFLAGYMPLQKRRAVIAGEAHEQERSLPRVEVMEVHRFAGKSEVELPGNIQA